MENKQDTVTISLQKYKEMEEELKTLRIKVQQKTIYKDIIPPIYGQILMVLILMFMVKMILV